MTWLYEHRVLPRMRGRPLLLLVPLQSGHGGMIAVVAAVVVTALVTSILWWLAARRRNARHAADTEGQLLSSRQSEERFRLTLEGVEDYAIFMLDPKGHIVNWNNGAERIKGYTSGEILGKHFSCFYPEELNREGLPEKSLAAAAAEGRFADEGWRLRKDGSRFWANLVITAIRDSEGKLLGFVKATRDLTGQRQSEQKIQQLNTALKLRADQLEQTNQELESFSHSVSHDLRAPLRHIQGFTKCLRQTADDRLDQKSQHYLNVIENSAKQMAALIDDLLVFSRMGRTEIRQTHVKLVPLVDKVIQDLAPEIQARKVEWKRDALPEVTGDASMLSQVFANLIGNALKYTRPRNPAVIEIGSTTASEEYIIFVRDNGVGFDMEYAPKLFGVFQRLHRSDEFEGTGVGLANVRRVIHRHGGRTWAEGKVGGGATFYFSLPKA